MKVQVFTLCDGAFNYNGRLTIVGSYDNLKVKEFPCSVDTSCAIKIETNQNDAGKKRMQVSIKDLKNHIINSGFNEVIDVPDVEIAHLGLTITFKGIPFSEANRYKVCIEIADSLNQELNFEVLKN